MERTGGLIGNGCGLGCQLLKLPSFLGRSFEAFTVAAFPSQCVGCGEVVDESSLYVSVCGACEPRVQTISSPKCLTCGFPFFGETESHGNCMHCEHLRPEFRQGWSIALFRGPLRGLIHELKYESGFWALRDIARLIRRAPGLEEFVGNAVLVAVPLHARKLRERGYNQSVLIADEIARALPASGRDDLLVRALDTTSQTQFDRRDRIRNLKNAFSLRRNRAIEPAQRYIVVDDVFTTGSTLNACAAALRRAGARSVDVLAIGHG